MTFQDLQEVVGERAELIGDLLQLSEAAVRREPRDHGAISGVNFLPGRGPLPCRRQRNGLLEAGGDHLDDVAPGERDPLARAAKRSLLGHDLLREPLDFGGSRDQGGEVEAEGLRDRPVPALAGIALAVGAVPADDQASVDEERQVPPHGRRGHAVRPQRDLLVRGEDDQIVPRQDGFWVEGQEGVQHRERALAETEPCAGRAKRAKDLPFVRRRLRRALLCDHLACDLGKR